MAREADLQRTKNLIAFGLSMPILNWMRKSLRKNALSLEDLYSPAMIWRSMEIDDETMLQHYKGLQSVERGFRFLKDKRFNIAQVYLKKEERIQALAMIMVLTLLVYSIAEWMLRKRLMETGNSIPNQLKKPTQKPTLKWVFFLFNGVADVKVSIMGITHREMTQLTEVLKLILKLMGPECEKYYAEEW
jgi:transposase